MKITLAIILVVLAALCTDITAKVVKATEKPQHISRKPTCSGKTTTIAVIDTGFGYEGANEVQEQTVRLCKFGHKDFTNTKLATEFDTVDPVPVDNHGHGTNIVGIIDGYASAQNLNYCIVIIKYFDKKDVDGNVNLANTIAAIKYATKIHADYINYSGGGIQKNDDEVAAVKIYLDQGGHFIAAAGNEHSDLEKIPYYPAMDDDRIVVVGALQKDMVTPELYSNFGDRVDEWEVGDHVIANGLQASGTSQATAAATGKIVGETKNFCK